MTPMTRLFIDVYQIQLTDAQRVAVELLERNGKVFAVDFTEADCEEMADELCDYTVTH